ncbi:MAG: hypothetical protein ABSF60_02515 [Verrucomicrobiota bacterium]
MIRKLHDGIIAPLRRLDELTVQRFNGLTAQNLFVLCLAVFPLFARAQTSFPDTSSARSVSGQFIVTSVPSRPGASRLAARTEIATNTDFVRLEPAVLAVSAERIKESLGHELNPERRGLDFSRPATGKIFLALHPAQSPDEGVTIVSRRSPDGWDYQVQLPDVLTRTRYLRAMTGVLLLEFANRDARTRSAEIPAWLTDGLSQELLATAGQEIILSSPDKLVNGLPVNRTVKTTRGVDSLAGARRVLLDHAVLTFEQLSWPTDAQQFGADGGAYRASAQLFVSELLALKNGPAHLRAMLKTLPKYYNWQVSFQTAFQEDFPRPLDVEKWWAVQVVSFGARDPGPAWTFAVSRNKLDEILSVRVEMRAASNALPAHAEISLQALIRNFDRSRQVAILQSKLYALELAQMRMAPPFVVLTDEYRRAIADYLGSGQRTSPVLRWIKHPFSSPSKAIRTDTLKRLDALDAQRRAIESGLKPAIPPP